MLKVYNIDQAEQWDAIVRSFIDYDSYWLSGYVKAFQIHGDGEPLLFFYDDGETRGVNVVMKRDIADDPHFENILDKGMYFDFASPYGYGGWLIEGKETGPLFAVYEQWCKEYNIISEFVRFHPVVHNQVMNMDFYTIVELGKVVTLNISSPDIIWENITSKNRNMIRKAIKSGVKIYNGRYPEIYEQFRLIYNQTMDKDNANSYYYFKPDFYDSLLNDLPLNSEVFYAMYENHVIAASIMLFANGKMNYHLSGSIKEFSNLAPTNLLLYQASLWGYNNGYKTLYLGGGVGSGEDSLFRFKKAFYRNDDLNSFYIGKHVYNEEQYDLLVNMRNDLSIKGSYFPEYRA